MDQDQTNQGSPLESSPENELKKLRDNFHQISNELRTIKTSVEKRKSETTTLKILFYTALAALLFGFIYTNQTLQRAQHNNLQENISALKSKANQDLLSLERKLHQKILKNKSENPQNKLHKWTQNLNRTLSKLQPENKKIDKLIEKVKKDSEELNNLVRNEQKDKDLVPEAVP